MSAAPVCSECGEPYIGGDGIAYMHPFCPGPIHRVTKATEALRARAEKAEADLLKLRDDAASYLFWSPPPGREDDKTCWRDPYEHAEARARLEETVKRLRPTSAQNTGEKT